MTTKARLRKIYLEKQKSLSEAERNARSRKIADEFFEKINLQNIRFLHVFLPIEKNREIETAFIFKRLWENLPAITTIAPRVNFQSLTLENFGFDAKTKLVRNRWQIFEPAESERVAPEKIDIVLVPLLAFDERGFRVGYGMGFYDEFLSRCRTDCVKIGVSYFAPTAEITDAAAFDVRLDFCITPEKIWRF